MPLTIDRVQTQMDVLPGAQASTSAGAPPAANTAANSEPLERDNFKDKVLDALKDHLRALERRGML